MKVIMILLVMALAGCSAWQAVVAQRGAEISDSALQAALWTICNASPVGAVTRHFNTPELKQAYAVICKASLEFPQSRPSSDTQSHPASNTRTESGVRQPMA